MLESPEFYRYANVCWEYVIICFLFTAIILQSIQCGIVRNLIDRYNPESVEWIFKTNEILKIVDIYWCKVYIHMFRVVVLNDSPYLKGNLELQTNEHPHITRNWGHYKQPFPRVESIRNAYSYQFIKLWNELAGHSKAINFQDNEQRESF